MTSELPRLCLFRNAVSRALPRWLAVLALVTLGMGQAMAANPPVVDLSFSGAISDKAAAGAVITVHNDQAKAHPTSGATDQDYGPTNDSQTVFMAGAQPYWQWHSPSAYGGGLTVDIPTIAFPNGNFHTYSLGLRFSLSAVNGYKKVIDFKNRTADNGFYIHDGHINFFTTTSQGDQGTFNADTTYDFLIVRNQAARTFKVFLNGDAAHPVFSLANITDDVAVPSTVGAYQRFGFFFDDVAVRDGASPSGKAYSLKVWNDALTNSEVSDPTLLNAPPDTTPPAIDLANSNPANNAAGVALDANLVMVFSENIKLGQAGSIVLVDRRTNAIVETFSVVNGVATGSAGGAATVNTNQLTVHPGLPMLAGNNYSMNVTAGAITDVSINPNPNGNSIAAGGLNFSTVPVNIGGAVSGLVGSGLVLHNGSDSLAIAADGAFTFPTGIVIGGAYDVTVTTQPSSPTQTCAVTHGSGVGAGAHVGNVQVSCLPPTYTVGGTVSGLVPGGQVSLRNASTTEIITLGVNGAYAFTGRQNNTSAYDVSVWIQPSATNQVCTITNSNGTGSIASANVSNVDISCTTPPATWALAGIVSGLTAGKTVVLQTNTGESTTVSYPAAGFTFPTNIANGSYYKVSVQTHPTGLTCAVANAKGTATANVTNIAVICTANAFTVGGTVSGLAYGASVVLQNNSGENLNETVDGGFTFVTPVAQSGSYAVTVLTPPASPKQTCTVTGGGVANDGTGTNIQANVTNVNVNCVTNTFTVGGTVSGLVAGGSVVLTSNLGQNVAVSANGSFTFPTAVNDKTYYKVSVQSPPISPSQSCEITFPKGNVNAANVTNISVACVTNNYTVGGTVSGLNGGAVVVANGAQTLTLSANAAYAFPAQADGTHYSVTVQTQPSSPRQTCTLANGTGQLTGANATNANITCSTNAYAIKGNVTGLRNGTSLVLKLGGENLTVSGNGLFSFVNRLVDQSAYSVSILTQPSGSPSQTCTVTDATGAVAGADIESVNVICSVNTYTVGGTVSGLIGTGAVVLSANFGQTVSVSANGAFAFPTGVADGTFYKVSLQTAPTVPQQTCTITGFKGYVAGAIVNTVAVTCATNNYGIGGALSGLASGATVVLSNNSGDDITLSANGAFTFPTPLADGSAYVVTVHTQPGNPRQTCTVSDGSATLAGKDVVNIFVACSTNSYTLGGTLTGLAGSGPVVIKTNTGDQLSLSANGAFTFGTKLADGATYKVSVATQPGSPSQNCTITSPKGTVAGADISNMVVTCATNTYTVGGTLSGLASGAQVMIANNSGDSLTLSTNGAFTFPTGLADTSAYVVTVQTQPGSPAQTCTVANGSGTLAGANVSNVAMNCSTNSFMLGGTLTGLAGSNQITISSGTGQTLSLSANGAFSFAAPLADGTAYKVSVTTQPGKLSQICSVTSPKGTIAGANVTNVLVTCATNAYSVGGALSGLASGATVVLSNNNGDDITLSANGAFTFPSTLADGSAYVVSVHTQPSNPTQTCTVSDGSATLAGKDVVNIFVACSTNSYTLGGSLTGLAGSGPVVIKTNTGDQLSLSANGAFTFGTKLADGATYKVSVATQPGSPSQTCTITSPKGTVAGADISNMVVTCATNTYTVGGTLSGLASGAQVTLAKNSGDSLTLSTNGAFTFPTALADTSAYVVTVQTQPGSPAQTCTVTNGSGTLAGANVSNVAVSCTTNSYSVGGNVTGLSGSGLVLQINGANNLVIGGNGAFSFNTPLTAGSSYSVTVLTQPGTPTQTCSVSNASGTIAAAHVSNVAVSCVTGSTVPTASGTIPGAAGTVTATISSNTAGCGFTRASFVSAATLPNPPIGVTFPMGVLDFATAQCGAGGSITVRITYPQNLPANAQYWKYGRANRNDVTPSWYVLPANIAGNQVQFSITDGELGDDDWTKNGVIIDPSGPGIGAAISGTPAPIPTLSEWGMVVLSCLLALFGMVSMRRNRG